MTERHISQNNKNSFPSH